MLLLEGTHLLEEALRIHLFPKEIIATIPWLEAHADEIRELPPLTKIYKVAPPVLAASLSTVNPDGVAALLPLNNLPQEKNHPEFVLALDRLQDPGNLGNLFRTALAADVDTLWLASGCDPLSPKALRASSGAILHLPFMRFGPNEDAAIDQISERLLLASSSGYQVVASLIPEDKSTTRLIPYWELDWQKPTVVMLGNEGRGLHSRLLPCCTHYVTLPHSSKIESLNVAAAAVPLLLERRRAKMTSALKISE